ncbi:hypothetical protein MMC28_010300 [Mycoblastus sanguinarius]|nr:hypothetical protein [Mycoblastus sanguinarius]
MPQYPPLPASPSSVSQPHPTYGVNGDTDPTLGHNQMSTPTQTQTPFRNVTHDSKARLRKACDSCSIRKVKCDESGPPCKACIGLDIPCTFDRPSKRRGPPNRHAESLKKQRIESPGTSGQSQPSSPTHAAQTLASFAQHQVLSAETICPMPVLQLLIDDYFTYIHPLIPLPHEPSFRMALDHREDLNNPTFLALLASMVGYLVASFPRRPRQHFRLFHMDNLFTNSMSLINRCHKVAVESQGSGYLDRSMSVHDAVISYLQGLTAAYTFNQQASILYFKQCLSISTTIGLHKARDMKRSNGVGPPPRMTANGHTLQGPQALGPDLILQELGKRTFWALAVSTKSLRQLGVSQWELLLPPATASEPYPPLPLEVDDAYLTQSQILPQPPDQISELVGFNANVRVFTTYDDFSTIELFQGVNQLVDWKMQKRVLEASLQAVKLVLGSLPHELLLSPQDLPLQSQEHRYPSPAHALSNTEDMNHQDTNSQETNHQQPNGYGFDHSTIDYNRVVERQRIQYEVQKANIYASQLGTRSYLVEKYWHLYQAHSHKTGSQATTPSPGVIAPLLDQYNASRNNFSMTEQDMAEEREDIVKSFLLVLGSINQVNMEPNGTSFISKIRQIASTLVDPPHSRKGPVALKADGYLRAFLDVLMKLERMDPLGEDTAEDGEAQLRAWAVLGDHQVSFAQAEGFRSEA